MIITIKFINIFLILLSITLLYKTIKPFSWGFFSIKVFFFTSFILFCIKNFFNLALEINKEDFYLSILYFYIGVLLGILFTFKISSRISSTKYLEKRILHLLSKVESIKFKLSTLVILWLIFNSLYVLPKFFFIVKTNNILAARQIFQYGGLGLPYIDLSIYSLIISILVIIHFKTSRLILKYFLSLFTGVAFFFSGSNTLTLYPILLFFFIETERRISLFKSLRPLIVLFTISVITIIPIIILNYLLRWHNIENFLNFGKTYFIIILKRILEDQTYFFFEHYTESFWMGKSFIYILLQPIPRFLLPDKPLLVDSYLTNTFQVDYAKLEFGPIVEGYINFGYAGCLLWGILSILVPLIFLGLRYRTLYFYLFTNICWSLYYFDFGIDRYYMVNLLFFAFISIIIINFFKLRRY